jgi:hypothetical protein
MGRELIFDRFSQQVGEIGFYLGAALALGAAR